MDTEAVLALMVEVAEEVIVPRFRTLEAGQVDEKNPGDLVTVADREAEVLLTRALLAAHPGAVVLGEEAYAGDPTLLKAFRTADHAFTVDPVDGTKNFVHGSKDHAVMVGEVRAGEVVRGWIWQPQHELAYVAERGAGAWRNAERLTRPPVTGEPRVVTSRRRWLGRSLDGMPPLELTWVCCGVDYPKLVEGEADAIVYGRARSWRARRAPRGCWWRPTGVRTTGSSATSDQEPPPLSGPGPPRTPDRRLLARPRRRW